MPQANGEARAAAPRRARSTHRRRRCRCGKGRTSGGISCGGDFHGPLCVPADTTMPATMEPSFDIGLTRYLTAVQDGMRFDDCRIVAINRIPLEDLSG